MVVVNDDSDAAGDDDESVDRLCKKKLEKGDNARWVSAKEMMMMMMVLTILSKENAKMLEPARKLKVCRPLKMLMLPCHPKYAKEYCSTDPTVKKIKTFFDMRRRKMLAARPFALRTPRAILCVCA